jgi:hypothetical protein
MSEIKNPTNQVHLWRGQVVYTPDDGVRHFETEAEAWAFVSRCDQAGRVLAA